MPSETVVVTIDYICAQETVWDVLVKPQLWLNSVGPVELPNGTQELSLGEKLHIADANVTSVVTVFEPKTQLSISTGQQVDTYLLLATEFGCRVTLRTSNPAGAIDVIQAQNQQQLTALKKVAYDHIDIQPKTVPILRTRRRKKLRDVFYGLVQGYKTPTEPQASAMADSLQISTMADSTEGGVVIHMRAALVALMCGVLLISTIAFVSQFERTGRVPSSGMYLNVSEDVNRYTAAHIQIGQYMADVELLLNCLGTRLSTTEYYYASPDGQSQLILSYDAYSRVREVRFLNLGRATTVETLPIIESAAVLDSTMGVLDVENAIDCTLSAFLLDKSGQTTIYFGKLENVERMLGGAEMNTTFTTLVTAQLIVTVHTAEHYAETQYFLPADIDNPLPSFSITDRTERQYRNYLESYRADRAAYERFYLLIGQRRIEAEFLLNTEGEYRVAEGTDGDVFGMFNVHSRVVDEAGYRYLYTIQFDETQERISEVTMLNRFLEQKEDMLPESDNYSLTIGMPLYYVYAQLGILPTYTILNDNTLTLCFGMRVANFKRAVQNFELCLVLDAQTRQVTEIHDNT